MFRLDTTTNSITPIERRSFASLSYGERKHLQEWVAGSPECLGEDLLIIQKEFDGFDETRERLDLLAIDKDGQLVVIENKLDDSGRDVVWQALKYASYCATLTRTRIVDLYRGYLQRQNVDEDPEELLREFLEVEDIGDVQFNNGSDQRILLIAANFRREVTSTVLWLRNHQIDIRCIRAMPYKLGDEILLNFEQIIPVPEAADFMIGVSEKNAEQRSISGGDAARYNRRREFWAACLSAIKASDIRLYDNISPSKDHWLSAGSGVRSCPYQLIFGIREARVQLELIRSERSENKALFDELYAHRAQIEHDFGGPLEWKRLDNRKSSRVEFARNFDGYDAENWPEMIEWMVDHLRRLQKAIDVPLKSAAETTI
ncbi:DUF4268 domain-containing protein [Tsuneonella suprasediminis]|uniref:DUF4268 domain-containing protein n=1 Tax=Tsuneonella suprasediminis TaxID=2306996 RepID=UPI002F92627C